MKSPALSLSLFPSLPLSLPLFIFPSLSAHFLSNPPAPPSPSHRHLGWTRVLWVRSPSQRRMPLLIRFRRPWIQTRSQSRCPVFGSFFMEKSGVSGMDYSRAERHGEVSKDGERSADTDSGRDASEIVEYSFKVRREVRSLCDLNRKWMTYQWIE